MHAFNPLKVRERLKSSYWFLPLLMSITTFSLAWFTVSLDRAGRGVRLKEWGWLYNGQTDTAVALVTTITNALMTVSITAFSLTLVVFTLASQQYGPRVVRNFMQDVSYQLVLTTFTATFVYCLPVLWSMQKTGNSEFVPSISITVVFLLTLLSIAMLIYFIHHATVSIHSWHILTKISKELNGAIDYFFFENVRHRVPQDKQRPVNEIPLGFDENACRIFATRIGYIQAIDYNRLMKIAKSHDLLMRIEERPGKFIYPGKQLMLVWPKQRVDEKLIKKLDYTVVLGEERTAGQDIEHSVKQLTEIAIRAISPAVNDPFTGIRCIDLLCVALRRIAQRDFLSPYRYDENYNLRLIVNQEDFPGLLDDAFHLIRQFGRSDPSIIIRLLEAITMIGEVTKNSKDRTELRRHADMFYRVSQEAMSEELDRQDVQVAYQRASAILEQQEV